MWRKKLYTINQKRDAFGHVQKCKQRSQYSEHLSGVDPARPLEEKESALITYQAQKMSKSIHNSANQWRLLPQPFTLYSPLPTWEKVQESKNHGYQAKTKRLNNENLEITKKLTTACSLLELEERRRLGLSGFWIILWHWAFKLLNGTWGKTQVKIFSIPWK